MWSQRSSLSREPNPLALALGRFRASGRPLLDLTESNPTRAGIDYDARAIVAAFADERVMTYEPEPFGMRSARDAVAAELSRSRERVVLGSSTSEAYSLAFKLLCDPGDEVLVPQPSYPLFEHLARFDAVVPVQYRLVYDGAWHIDLDSVRRAVGPRTRAVVVVTPNNPTGSYLRRSELDALVEIGLPIVADEVFAGYPLEPPLDRAGALDQDALLGLALGGLSKQCGLPQLKLAWMVLGGPEPLVTEALARLELIADAYLSLGAPVQVALPRLLEAGRLSARAIHERARTNLARLRAALTGSAVTLLRTEGGWYAVLRLPKIASEEAWVVGLLEQEGVLVQPGWFYDFADEPYAVVSLLTPEETLDAGIARLVRFVER